MGYKDNSLNNCKYNLKFKLSKFDYRMILLKMDGILETLKNNVLGREKAVTEDEREFNSLFDDYNQKVNTRELERQQVLAENMDILREMSKDVRNLIAYVSENVFIDILDKLVLINFNLRF